MKTKLILVSIWISLLVISACSINKNEKEKIWLANPASVYCEDNWWKLEIISSLEGEHWICHFSDGNFCEEREFYRWECAQSWNNNLSNINTKKEDKQNITWDISWENFCTMDAKQCTDWSYVSRVWPSCEFAPCPNEVEQSTNTIKTKDIQEIIDKHKENIDTNNTWLTETDIDLMEKVIEGIQW